VTTAGFEDTLYIQRINRPTLYDLQWEKPQPLVRSRRHCLGVRERITADGAVYRPLLPAEVERLCQALAALPIEAIAVSLLFSYVNPSHEEQLRAALRERFPHLPLSISHEVAPIWREYERASTTVADAYLKPLMQRYLASLDDALATLGLRARWTVMKSNGGAMLAAAAAAAPIHTVMSGPAAGMIASRHVARLYGAPHVISMDMGGTSFDVGLIADGEFAHTTDFEIGWGIPAAVPLVDIKSIGAGGGSIAWVDAGGFLRVGPESAGAEPGPICYGKGGEQVTVTDANLVLGRLDTSYFLAGRMRLAIEQTEALLDAMAARLGMGRLDLASAIVEIADENMASAIKMVTLERGADPRQFSLLAFGGAGPLHAASLARRLHIATVIVPLHPGNFSALGLLLSDVRVDKVWTQAFRSTDVDPRVVDEQFGRVARQAVAEVLAEGCPGQPEVAYAINMRYFGQNYEHEVPLSATVVTDVVLADAFAAFERIHRALYGYAMAHEVVELISFKVTAVGRRSKPALVPAAPDGAPPRPRQQAVYFRGHGFVPAPIVHRATLAGGARLDGPALVVEEGSTTLGEPGMTLEHRADGLLVIHTGASMPPR
jgi:N-methylhydantoinase A